MLGRVLTLGVELGTTLGIPLGDPLGVKLGAPLGELLGVKLGVELGEPLGKLLGWLVGAAVGLDVGGAWHRSAEKPARAAKHKLEYGHCLIPHTLGSYSTEPEKINEAMGIEELDTFASKMVPANARRT